MKQVNRQPLCKKLVAASCMFLVLAATFMPAAALADQYMDYGIAMLRTRDFVTAKKYFDQRLKLAPNDTHAIYYKAVCCSYMRDVEAAKALYTEIVQQYPNSDMAGQAAANLKKMEQNAVAASASTSAPKSAAATAASKTPTAADFENEMTGIDSSKDVVPDSARVHFFRDSGNDVIVKGEIEGRPIDMQFDTGAAGMFMGRNHLESLGLRVAENAKTGIAMGVGGAVETKTMNLMISVGGIKRRLPVMISGHFGTYPLLGQTFFKDLEYEFDNKGSYIVFRKSHAMDVSKDQYCVPFRKKGQHIVVDVQTPGGGKTSMIVDTGAASIVFTQRNLDDLKLEIPSNATKQMSSGVGGTQLSYAFSIGELRLGPIVQRDLGVSAITSGDGFLGEGGVEGLLGQPFFADWRYTIDNRNMVLRFFH